MKITFFIIIEQHLKSTGGNVVLIMVNGIHIQMTHLLKKLRIIFLNQ